MADARIFGVAFILISKGLPGMGEKDGMFVSGFRLQAFDREVLLGDDVGMRFLFFAAVQRIDLLAQHGALQRAARFPLFFQRQSGRKHRVVKQQFLRFFIVGGSGSR